MTWWRTDRSRAMVLTSCAASRVPAGRSWCTRFREVPESPPWSRRFWPSRHPVLRAMPFSEPRTNSPRCSLPRRVATSSSRRSVTGACPVTWPVTRSRARSSWLAPGTPWHRACTPTPSASIPYRVKVRVLRNPAGTHIRRVVDEVHQIAPGGAGGPRAELLYRWDGETEGTAASWIEEPADRRGGGRRR
jgi:hypothetical protein